ncbi:MAG: RNA-binding protein [Halobacteriales archaeon]
MEVSSRHHLRSDAVRDLENALADSFGIDAGADSYERVEIDGEETDLVLADGEPFAVYFDGEPAPTVRGANAADPTKRLVTVDAGAVSFVSDGADVMRPGIVEVTDDIESGDLVLVAEAVHGKVLAVGRARVPGTEMAGDSGKVVDSIHHVGDDLYDFTP